MKEVKVQVLSDLHLEIATTIRFLPDIPVLGEILVLAGDIGNPRLPRQNKHVVGKDMKKFFSIFNDRYKKILYVPGNHEYYHGEYHETKILLQELCSKYENVELLDNKSYVFNGVRFVGSTLWSDIDRNPEVEKLLKKKMSDYNGAIKYVDREKEEEREGEEDDDAKEDGNILERKKKVLPLITIDQTRRHFQQNVQFIEQEIETAKKKGERVVVISHNPPISKGVSSVSRLGEYHQICNSAWVNNLDHMIKPPLVAWIYGHTHFNGRVKVNNIPIVCNQWGYRLKNKLVPNFDPNFVISV